MAAKNLAWLFYYCESTRMPRFGIAIYFTAVLQLVSVLKLCISEKAQKILIVTIDNRKLDAEKASYSTIGAVLNYLYAHKHGYTYLYLRHRIDLKELRRKYRADRLNDLPAGFCFHPTHHQIRASSWAKLPILWHISQTMPEYDYIIYVDPDTVFTPANSNRTISQALIDWKANSKITWGPRPEIADILFSHNAPFGEQEPSIGWFMFRPNAGARIFSEWWDYNLPEKSKEAAFDQDALWKILNKERVKDYNFAINRSTSATLLKENQFPVGEQASMEEWCLRSGWICHLSSSYGGADDKIRIMRDMLRQVSTDISTPAFKNVVETINTQYVTKLETLAIAERMPKTEVIKLTSSATSASSSSPEKQKSNSESEYVVEEGGIRRDRSKASENELENTAKTLLELAAPLEKARNIIAKTGENSTIGSKLTTVLDAYVEGQISKDMLTAMVRRLERQLKNQQHGTSNK